jgi:methyltransferase (TIGR00027 family)
MDPVAKTAYYCCGVRAQDAASPNPVCGDAYAARFMTDEGREIFQRFAHLINPNRTNATRARIIDDLLREILSANPAQRIILIGAGFDSRAFRLPGGSWVELDQPAVMAIKAQVLPESETQNELVRIGIDFAQDKLAHKLAPFAGEAGAVVVLEGVSMYLSQDELRGTLSVLREMLPRHSLVCDLMSARFGGRGAEIRQRLAELGAHFAPLADEPERTMTDMGYREISRQSIIGRARELGAIRVPGLIFHTLLRKLRDGYQVHVFHSA